MTGEGFEATFSIEVRRGLAWLRLTETPSDPDVEGHLWLPGFDSSVTVVDSDPHHRLRATKDEEPCAGTEIVVTLEDHATGTRILVVQSGFGDWLGNRRDLMSVGWRQIVADLETYLATGVHARRFLRPFGDFGATTYVADGGIRIGAVRPDGLAAQLGLVDGDLLVELSGAPVVSLDDLFTILRVSGGVPVSAAWVRLGLLMVTT